MAENTNPQPKELLFSNFSDGKTPDGSQFAELIESFVHKTEANQEIENNLRIKNILTLGASPLPENQEFPPGSIRWNEESSQLEFTVNGETWHAIGSGGGQDLPSNSEGYSIEAIEAYSGSLPFPEGLEPFIIDTGIDDMDVVGDPQGLIRVGRAIMGNIYNQDIGAKVLFGADLFLGSEINGYALSQTETGLTILNAPELDNTGSGIYFTFNGAESLGEINGYDTDLSPNFAPVEIKMEQSGTVKRPRMTVNGDIICKGFIHAEGEITSAAGVPAQGTDPTTSDIRLKKDITPMQEGLNIIKHISPVNFRFNGKAGTSDTNEHIGVIAQEIQKYFPRMVSTFKGRLEPADEQETDLLQVKSSSFLYLLINAVKELDTKVDELKSELEKYKSIAPKL